MNSKNAFTVEVKLSRKMVKKVVSNNTNVMLAIVNLQEEKGSMLKNYGVNMFMVNRPIFNYLLSIKFH